MRSLTANMVLPEVVGEQDKVKSSDVEQLAHLFGPPAMGGHGTLSRFWRAHYFPDAIIKTCDRNYKLAMKPQSESIPSLFSEAFPPSSTAIYRSTPLNPDTRRLPQQTPSNLKSNHKLHLPIPLLLQPSPATSTNSISTSPPSLIRALCPART